MKVKQMIKNKVFHSIKSGWRWLSCRLCDPRWHRIGQVILAIVIMGVCLSTFADDGTDILKGTDASLWATLNGTGKNYIYAAEGILGLAGYMKTKNLLVLTGIVVVSIFFNIILSIAGQST